MPFSSQSAESQELQLSQTPYASGEQSEQHIVGCRSSTSGRRLPIGLFKASADSLEAQTLSCTSSGHNRSVTRHWPTSTLVAYIGRNDLEALSVAAPRRIG
jgi:hypothetical protein